MCLILLLLNTWGHQVVGRYWDLDGETLALGVLCARRPFKSGEEFPSQGLRAMCLARRWSSILGMRTGPFLVVFSPALEDDSFF